MRKQCAAKLLPDPISEVSLSGDFVSHICNIRRNSVSTERTWHRPGRHSASRSQLILDVGKHPGDAQGLNCQTEPEGLSSVSVTLLGTALVTGEVSAYFLRLSLSATLICGSYIGVGAYIYFRLWRYREMSPEEFGASGSQSRSVFRRRETSNRVAGPLRIGLILIALPAMWAAIILSSLVTDLIS